LETEEIKKLKQRLETLNLPQIGEDHIREKVKVLNNLAFALHRSDPERAVEYAQQSLTFADGMGFHKETADSLLIIGTSYWVRGDYDMARKYYSDSLKVCEEMGDTRSAASCHTNIGIILKNQGNYEQALEHYIKALKTKEDFKDKHGVAKCCNNIGIIYDEQGDYKHALTYYQKALDIFEELGDKQGIAFSYNNIGIISEAQGDFDQALEHYHKSLKIKEEIGDKKGVASSYLNLSSLFREQKEMDQVLEYCFKALKLYREIEDKRGIADTLTNIGRAYTQSSQFDFALSHLQEGLKLAEEMGVKDLELESYQYLSNLFEAQKKYKESLDYYKKFNDLRIELYNMESAEKIAQLQVKYESDKKEKEAEIHRLKNIELQREIAIRKQTEEDLLENRRMLRSILESTGDGILVVHNGGIFTYSNKRFAKMWNVPQDVLEVGDRDRLQKEVIHQLQDSEGFQKKLLELNISVNEHLDYVEFKDGRIYERYSTPLFSEGKVSGRVFSFRDVTEKKKTEEYLQKLQKLESIGTLAGGIAHDFNNVLTVLFGNISIAKLELSDDHPSFPFIDDAIKSFSRATDLTRQLLTFAKGSEPIREDVDLGEIVMEATRFDLAGSNMKPIFDVADNLWIAKVDKGQVEQVISNLVINANQSMPEGGNLYISLENRNVENKDISNFESGKYIKVTVQDQGIGIDRKYIDRIFDPYFSTKQTGSGLGLATVFSIMNKHGGQISVESELGKGTIFTLFFPASETKSLIGTKRRPPESPDICENARILVMDDEENICKTVKSMLEKTGCKVETVEDGERAIEIYMDSFSKSEPFDIVIMDLTIPGGMGGKDAAKELLALDPDAKIIVFSGYSTDPIIANYQEYGFSGRLEKPFTIINLTREVIRVLKKI